MAGFLAKRSIATLHVLLAAVLAAGLACACGDGPSKRGPDEDAGTDADVRPPTCNESDVSWGKASISTAADTTRLVSLSLGLDYCEDVILNVSSSDRDIARILVDGKEVDEVTISPLSSQVFVEVKAMAPGEAVLTAEWADTGSKADINVTVTDDIMVDCSGSAAGLLVPGQTLEITEGSLAGSSLSIPAGALRNDRYRVPFALPELGCALDQVPDGHSALGPAVQLSPGHSSFARDLPLRIPVRLQDLPEGATLRHVMFSYTGPSIAEPRLVPVVVRSLRDGFADIEVPRLGTYQPVVSNDAGKVRMREFQFRVAIGVSMGAAGSATIGTRFPERFDGIAALGGPVDWIYMRDFIKRYPLGGFCDAQQWADDALNCAKGSSFSRVPSSTQYLEQPSHFERLWYDEGLGGQATVFNRNDYIAIFRDLARVYGNPFFDRSLDPNEPNVLPPGVLLSETDRADEQRCLRKHIIEPWSGDPGTGFFDREYNPQGQYRAITFCDGTELRVNGDRQVGFWAPDGYLPAEVLMAIDINNNGIRDRGEPVLRPGNEPFEDCGLDNVCSKDEPGYDPEANPDPAGDDYDYQFNPTGTEGNWLRDGGRCDLNGETFEDTGLDGVMNTPQLDAGGFDRGEGNGCYDIAAGFSRMLERNPRSLVGEWSSDDLLNTNVFLDGGVRDLFNFAVAEHQLLGAFSARGVPTRLYNEHSSMHLDGRRGSGNYRGQEVDWKDVGHAVMVRYGDIDRDDAGIRSGDGAHLGDPNQAVDRFDAGLRWASSLWPDGDFEFVPDKICLEGGTCDPATQFTIQFTSESGRTGPVTIQLPPGYYSEQDADLEYPVVYLFHGYGMDPTGLRILGLVLWNAFQDDDIPAYQRIQKAIIVATDGQCRGDECQTGTFFNDAPSNIPGGSTAESFFLEVVDYVDANFRTKPPAMHPWVD